ncbi:MAG: hypothetical protein OEQ13_00805 [Acidobacteriota bacterium]|nr:hypothetical protein [Acidobacteriota bacterium]
MMSPLTAVLGATLAFSMLCPPAVAQQQVVEELETIRKSAVSAYNSRDWRGAAQAAGSFENALEAAGLPRAGADFALVAFIGGHARFEIWKQDPDSSQHDFDEDVIGAMQESLKILQDDPFFKHNVLGTAYYERLKHESFRNLELENAANWQLYKALLARAEELESGEQDAEALDSFAKYVLLYISRGFEMARHSPAPDVYLIRLREACRLGFGSRYDDRFVQLFDVLGFDNGNVRAGVLWQIGLDLMNSEDGDPDTVLATFREAAEETTGRTERAEVFRQMADFASRLEDHAYKLQAVEYGRLAYRLDPANADVQMQFGTSLHVMSYAHFNSGQYLEALKAAREATSFEWDGDELAYFDLSRAQANFGDKIDALVHAERAYDKARKKYVASELQPFRQNYVNILRQFGLSAKARQIEAEGQGS